jgi:hypothetical protein
MMKLTGDTYGRGTVLWEAAPQTRADNGQARRFFEVECSCGTRYTARMDHLRSGASTSCGCWHREVAAKPRQRTGLPPPHPERKALTNARQRCTNPNDSNRENYIDRGIEVAAYWEGKDGMIRFLEYMGPMPEGMSLERIDNDGHYEEGNVKWATMKEQNANQGHGPTSPRLTPDDLYG